MCQSPLRTASSLTSRTRERQAPGPSSIPASLGQPQHHLCYFESSEKPHQDRIGHAGQPLEERQGRLMVELGCRERLGLAPVKGTGRSRDGHHSVCPAGLKMYQHFLYFPFHENFREHSPSPIFSHYGFPDYSSSQ